MSRSDLLREVLKERIVLFDGAMGTMIQAENLSPEDFGGEHLDGCNENLVLTRPDTIEGIHRAYLEAGSDVVETNTFGATPLVLAEYDLADRALEINRVAAQIARRAVDALTTPDKPRFVAGSMGPTTKTITVTGGVTFDELAENFAVQAEGLIEGGSDVLLLETAQDTLNLKAAVVGVRRALEKLGADLPLMVSGTIEPMGAMLAGQGVEALYTSLEHVDLLSIGLNCATGPRFMTDHIRSLSEIAHTHISCVPNAGLPDEEGRYNESPAAVAAVLRNFAEEGWINILGGCCGTTPEYITAIAEATKDCKPRVPNGSARFHVSGVEYLEITSDNRPIMVGERTNVIGSRKFKRLIGEGKFEEAAEIARKQVRGGAQIIDACLANPDREELDDMIQFLERLTKQVKATIMVDSTDSEVIEEALRRCQGKCVINSINLEDGEERFEEVVPIAKRYGAALVVGCIDDDPDQGMAVTVERKLEVARRSYDLLTKKYGIRPQDIIFDALVFPCATGDENYLGSAAQTIEGVRAIKEALPDTLTILGVSNVSFGLPPAGREVVNSVFLYDCTKAGLDMAIVNTQKLERYASIPEEERQLAEDVLLNRGEDPITPFVDFYRGRKAKEKHHVRPETVEERLALNIVEGSKDGLIEDLDLALEKYAPLEVINGPLMTGMDKVGVLFNNNELIVTEVLQSAEAMKAAVAHLEPLMEKLGSSSKGSIVLATVKGDVHDIGKNLVEIILTNNGYQVINLGIKVPPERLIEAYNEHHPDMIGLSGLLVKSAHQMVISAHDLRAAGVEVPVLVGGAALSRPFTRNKIAPQYDGPVVYAKDAMQGLDLANQLQDPQRRPALLDSLEEESSRAAERAAKPAQRTVVTAGTQRAIPEAAVCPSPPDFKAHVLDAHPLDEVFSYINLQMLLGKHLGLKGNVGKLLEQGNAKAKDLWEQVQAIQDEVITKSIFTTRAVYQFFPTYSEGNTQYVLDSARSSVLEEIHFPRQTKNDCLCAADLVASKASGSADNFAMFVTTCGGPEFMTYVTELKDRGEYVKSIVLQALAIESAEAFAELLHEKIRTMWGITDLPEMTLLQKIQAHYQGIRLSFGYPACPSLDDQEILFRLLQPERIGVALTEGHMMEPESSVSAMVYHHPEARYFTVAE